MEIELIVLIKVMRVLVPEIHVELSVVGWKYTDWATKSAKCVDVLNMRVKVLLLAKPGKVFLAAFIINLDQTCVHTLAIKSLIILAIILANE